MRLRRDYGSLLRLASSSALTRHAVKRSAGKRHRVNLSSGGHVKSAKTAKGAALSLLQMLYKHRYRFHRLPHTVADFDNGFTGLLGQINTGLGL